MRATSSSSMCVTLFLGRRSDEERIHLLRHARAREPALYGLLPGSGEALTQLRIALKDAQALGQRPNVALGEDVSHAEAFAEMDLLLP